MSCAPLVSVLFPVWRETRLVVGAVRSVLDQIVGNLELLVLSDGASEETLELASSPKDARVFVLRFPHRGLTDTLIDGSRAARGRYLARMDADDVCSRERFAKQLAFLRRHRSCVAAGTAYRVVAEDNQPLYVRHPPCRHEDIVRGLLTGRNQICHGSVMMRRDAFLGVGGYRAGLPYAQDFDLWLRLSTAGRLANLHEVLYTRRERIESIRYQRGMEQQFCREWALERHRAGGAGGARALPERFVAGGWPLPQRGRRAACDYYFECAFRLVHSNYYGLALRYFLAGARSGCSLLPHWRTVVAAAAGIAFPKTVAAVLRSRDAWDGDGIVYHAPRASPNGVRPAGNRSSAG